MIWGGEIKMIKIIDIGGGRIRRGKNRAFLL